MEHCKPTTTLTLSFFIFFSICALFGTTRFKAAEEIRGQLTSQAEFYLQKTQKEMMPEGITSRRLLGGPGSWPPRCISKCGRCTPCRPVHVPVPPGTPVTAEYYPEAWRCKCGNRLYMP